MPREEKNGIMEAFCLPTSGGRLKSCLLVANSLEGSPKRTEAGVRRSEPARCPGLLQGEARPLQEGEELLQA